MLYIDGRNLPILKNDVQGKFSVKSTWRAAKGIAAHWAIFSFIWKSYIPTKICVLVWKLYFNGIPTSDKMCKCRIPLASKCLCCEIHKVVTTNHLFNKSKITLWLGIILVLCLGLPTFPIFHGKISV